MRYAMTALLALVAFSPGCTDEPVRRNEEPPADKGAFFEAAGKGKVAEVRAALEAHPEWAGARSEEGPLGRTALDYAVDGGHLDAVRLLIGAGADVAGSVHSAGRPLHRTLAANHPEVARLLIEAGADVKARGRNGLAPLHLAVGWNQKALVELLLAKGADVNAQDGEGGGNGTPLHYAARGGHVEIVKLLLAGGADAAARDFAGKTPLDRALAGGHEGVADLLRKHGAAATEKPTVRWSKPAGGLSLGIQVPAEPIVFVPKKDWTGPVIIVEPSRSGQQTRRPGSGSP